MFLVAPGGSCPHHQRERAGRGPTPFFLTRFRRCTPYTAYYLYPNGGLNDRQETGWAGSSSYIRIVKSRRSYCTATERLGGDRDGAGTLEPRKNVSIRKKTTGQVASEQAGEQKEASSAETMESPIARKARAWRSEVAMAMDDSRPRRTRSVPRQEGSPSR